GVHALASVINYWSGRQAVTGDALYRDHPPADMHTGYSLDELMQLARAQGMVVSAVRLSRDQIIRELENGRPVLTPGRGPCVVVDPRGQLPGANAPSPVLQFPSSVVASRAARISEMTRLGLVNHYVVVAGYDTRRFLLMEPVMGFRTIGFARFERYRAPF